MYIGRDEVTYLDIDRDEDGRYPRPSSWQTFTCRKCGEPATADAYYHFYLLAMGAGRLRTPEELMRLMAQAGFTHLEQVPNPMPLHGRILLGRKSGGLPS